MEKDTRKLLKAAEAQGFTWDLTKSGHPRVYGPDGAFVTTLASTPSERRGWLNGLAKLRRAGLKWPP